MAPSTQPVLEILKKARKLIATPDKFCQGWLAQDANGYAAYVHSTYAKKFDLLGACIRTSPDFMFPVELADAFFGGNVAIFTDAHTHTEVLQALDDAIEWVVLTT